MSIHRLWAYVMACMLPVLSYGQDTLRLRLPAADSIFLHRNFDLLVARYDIDIAAAMTVQASLYPNPTLSGSGAIYNTENRKFPDISNSTGQYTVAIEQLIVLAGKRNKAVRLAQTEQQQSVAVFRELMRELRFELHSRFFEAAFLGSQIHLLTGQRDQLQRVQQAYDKLYQQKHVSLREHARIQALLFSINTSITDLRAKQSEAHAVLRLLLREPAVPLQAVYETVQLQPVNVFAYPLEQLIDTAIAFRPALQLAAADREWADRNLAYQKALAVPDLHLGAEFDKRGSFVTNATLLTFAIDIPAFNRNKGLIRAATIRQNQAKTKQEQRLLEIQTDVRQQWEQLLAAQQLYAASNETLTSNFNLLFRETTDQFVKGNLSLLEYVDFQSAYREQVQLQFEAANQYAQCLEALHNSVGKPIFQF